MQASTVVAHRYGVAIGRIAELRASEIPFALCFVVSIELMRTLTNLRGDLSCDGVPFRVLQASRAFSKIVVKQSGRSAGRIEARSVLIYARHHRSAEATEAKRRNNSAFARGSTCTSEVHRRPLLISSLRRNAMHEGIGL